MRKLYLMLVVVLALGMTSAAFAQDGSATVTLNEVGGSGESGTATLTDNGDGTTTVEIQLEGAPTDVAQPAHIHEGDCGSGGDIVYPLENVENGMSTSTVEASLDELVSGDFYVNVHMSPEDIATTVACGETEMAQMPDTGAGGMAGSQNRMPVVALAVVGLILAAGALMVVRARSV